MGQAAPVAHTLMDKHSSAGKHNAETNGLRRMRKQRLVIDGKFQVESQEMGRSGAKRMHRSNRGVADFSSRAGNKCLMLGRRQ